jgi:hypothetical protein
LAGLVAGVLGFWVHPQFAERFLPKGKTHNDNNVGT